VNKTASSTCKIQAAMNLNSNLIGQNLLAGAHIRSRTRESNPQDGATSVVFLRQKYRHLGTTHSQKIYISPIIPKDRPQAEGRIMNSFVISNCTYDGTSGDPNPICIVTGTVNSWKVYPQTFYRFLMAASSADQMQEALTSLMFNFYCGYRATLPWPNPIPFQSFPGSNAVATQSGGIYPVALVQVTQALILPWTA
jgi:hypothetical protein